MSVPTEGISSLGSAGISAGVAVASTIITSAFASADAKKQRELQKQLKLSELALTERLAMEKIRAEQETARTNILANSLLAYRQTLQTESTARLKDTWLYVTGWV